MCAVMWVLKVAKLISWINGACQKGPQGHIILFDNGAGYFIVLSQLICPLAAPSKKVDGSPRCWHRFDPTGSTSTLI